MYILALRKLWRGRRTQDLKFDILMSNPQILRLYSQPPFSISRLLLAVGQKLSPRGQVSSVSSSSLSTVVRISRAPLKNEVSASRTCCWPLIARKCEVLDLIPFHPPPLFPLLCAVLALCFGQSFNLPELNYPLGQSMKYCIFKCFVNLENIWYHFVTFMVPLSLLKEAAKVLSDWK